MAPTNITDNNYEKRIWRYTERQQNLYYLYVVAQLNFNFLVIILIGKKPKEIGYP